MLNNSFLRMLLDWRGTITRREYWASLLFLLILLSTYNLLSGWDELFRNSYLFSLGGNVDVLYILIEALKSILYVYKAIVAFSLIAITIKRCRALGFNKISTCALICAIYLAYFSLSFFHRVRLSGIFGKYSIEYSLLESGPILFSLLFLVLGIISVVVLSRQNDLDYDADVDYYSYNSINAIFGFFKLSLAYMVVFFLWRLLSSHFNYTFSSVPTWILIAILIFFIYNYLKIFTQRSEDAGVSKAYIIAYFSALAIFIFYFINSLEFRILRDYSISNSILDSFCFICVNLYFLYTFYLIALPTKVYDERLY